MKLSYVVPASGHTYMTHSYILKKEGRKEGRIQHILFYGYMARVLLYAPSHRQDSTYLGLCYTSRGALADILKKDPPPQCEHCQCILSAPHFGGVQSSRSDKK